MKSKYYKSGSLLLEILIVIGVVAIIIPIIAQIVITSLNSNKWTNENKTAASLADEAIRAIENVSFEKWQNIYSKMKGSANHYYITKNGGAWSTAIGDENLTVNNLNYVRYFTVFNVCRDDVTKIIITNAGVPPCTTGNSDDPSTQKITVTVTWANGTLNKDYYLTRWRNQVCHQTSWSGAGAGPVSCPSTLYESATNIDTSGTPGSLKLQAN
jgi:type II secretory pathway pseudopilin PulG